MLQKEEEPSDRDALQTATEQRAKEKEAGFKAEDIFVRGVSLFSLPQFEAQRTLF